MQKVIISTATVRILRTLQTGQKPAPAAAAEAAAGAVARAHGVGAGSGRRSLRQRPRGHAGRQLPPARPPPPAPPCFPLPPIGGGLGAGPSAGPGSEGTPGAAAAGACGCLPNPGTSEERHRQCKELLPIQMEGITLTVDKGLRNHFQVNHTVALSTIGESNYFGVTYMGTKQLIPTEAFPVLVGDMDNSGSLSAQVLHQLDPGLWSKMAIQTQQSKLVNWQVDGEYLGSEFTAAVTLGNPDVLVAHYLLSITPRLALGGKLVYHRQPKEEGTILSLAEKYPLNNWLATVTLGQADMHTTYYHKASDQLQGGVELEASTRMQDTSVSFGYQLDLPKANLLFKGSVDSNWIMGATLEKKLPPLPLTLALGAFLNHCKNNFQCGFGLTIR
ncbi:mitochondrial import receptor subunit TOM40 homolog [Cynocephalus volans]|uniref:mitochondrial import receptor subunit TOM40 homolog n=1 Tax=Cynocephalus volans TaxID=110931 RepID=UPI002FC83655